MRETGKMKRGLWRALLFGAIAGLPLLVSAASTSRVSVGGLLEVYPWPEEAENLVKNPSFEEIDDAGQVVGWKGAEPPHFSPTTEVSRSGLRSIHLRDSHLARHYPGMTQALTLSPGWYSMRGWMKAEGAGTNNRGAGGRMTVGWGKGWVSSPVIRGTTDWTKVEVRSFPIMPGESALLSLEAYRKPDGNVFFDDVEVRRQRPPLVEGFLRYPNYRGLLFEDRPQIIQMSVTVRPEEAKLRLSDLTIRLSLSKEGAEAAVVSVEQTPSTPSFLMTLDATVLPLGAYTLRLQALQRGTGALVFEYPRYRIVKLPATLRKGLGVYVDHDNVLVLGGRRTFVLGIYDTGGYSTSPSGYAPRLAEIAQAPINVYLNYHLGAAPVRALEALMTTLQHYGMWYLHTVNAWYPDNQYWPEKMPCNGSTASAMGPDRFTACMGAALAGHPGLAGWYTADEDKADRVERVFHQYTILRAAAPGGITFISQDRPRELVRWRDTVDVMGVDPYPIAHIPEGKVSPLEMVTDWVERAQAAVERSRPVWGTIQFFQFGSTGHWPTYDELRTMSYMAIVTGAKGLFYWSYGAKGLSWVKDPQRKAELWQRLIKVTREIKSLEPALLSPDAPEVLASHSPMGTIRVLPKRVGDTRYLIAVNNTSSEGVLAEFTLSESARSIEVVGEGRTAQLSTPNRFDDRFAPYATHVYKISGPTTR